MYVQRLKTQKIPKFALLKSICAFLQWVNSIFLHLLPIKEGGPLFFAFEADRSPSVGAGIKALGEIKGDTQVPKICALDPDPIS